MRERGTKHGVEDKQLTHWAGEIEHLLGVLASYGSGIGKGVSRLLYTREWMDAQSALAEILTQRGFEVYFDDVGNLYGRLGGKHPSRKSIVTGSHIDTVVQGGRFDGAAGIVAGIVALDHLQSTYGQPTTTIEVVSLAEEEGSRFPLTYWGSGSITGYHQGGKSESVHDPQGISLKQAMEELGFGLGRHRPCRREDLSAFIELHIEQGVVLERMGIPIGIAESIVGQRRFTIQVTGEAGHAGTTPMAWRRDALSGVSEMIRIVRSMASEAGAPMVATVGSLVIEPNIVNVIPGKVRFTLDVRHSSRATLDRFCTQLLQELRRISDEHGLGYQEDDWMNESPVRLHEGLCQKLEAVCERHQLEWLRMSSGAGHDAQLFQSVCPTALLFVPSVQGLSHCPEEHTDSRDLAKGALVLMQLLRELGYKEEFA